MFSTREVIRALQDANPGTRVSEDAIRVAIRRDKIKQLRTFAGRLVWSQADVAALAAAIGLACPSRPGEGADRIVS